MRTQPFEVPLPNWEEDDFSDSIIEAQLKASLANARQEATPMKQPAAHSTVSPGRNECRQHKGTVHQITVSTPQMESTLAQLIAGCGIAAVDGYLAMRDYATSKGLDLIELHHKGIDLQDLLSTAIIHTQRMQEMEGRQSAGANRRWRP